VATADGRFAYISNYGGGAYQSLTIVDLLAHQTLEAFDLGALRGPHGLAIAGGRIWFTAEAAKAVGRFDPVARTVDLVLGTGQDRTHMLYVSPDESRILTTNVSSATVSILDRHEPGGPPREPPRGPGALPPGPPRGPDWTTTVVPVGRGAEGFDVLPDGRESWVANAADGTISVIDLSTKRVVQTIDGNVRGANRLKFTPDGTRALVSSLRGPDVAVFDVARRAEARRIPVGRGAAGIQVQPDGARAFVACTPDDSVAVIDLQTLAVVGRIDAGRNPDGLAWAPSDR
jgi:YVTN family beta-propeller protein